MNEYKALFKSMLSGTQLTLIQNAKHTTPPKGHLYANVVGLAQHRGELVDNQFYYTTDCSELNSKEHSH